MAIYFALLQKSAHVADSAVCFWGSRIFGLNQLKGLQIMAAQDYAAVVQQLYVAYFGRPADYFGLQNFEAQLDAMGAPKTLTELNAAVQAGTTPALNALVNSFASSSESTALYGTDNSPIGISKFLVAVFQNVIGRTPDLGPGWDFWYNALATGALSRANAALAIAEGALSNTSAQGLLDAQAVVNKQKVASAFTTALDTPEKINAYSTAAAVATATGLLKDVTASTDVAAYQTTVLAAVSTVVTGSIGGTTANLTAAVETVAGTNGNDTFNGTYTQGGATGDTLNALDSIDGGSGTDTLNILALDALTSLPGGLVVKNVENLSFRGAAGITFDATATAGVTGVTSIAVTQATTAAITAASTTAVSVTGATGDVAIDGGSSQSVTTAGGAGVDIALGATTVAKGAISVVDSNQNTGTIAIDGGTTVSVSASGASTGTITLGQGGAATDKASGAVAVTSIGAASAAATDVTLGAITIDGGSTVTVIQTASSDGTSAATDGTGSTITQSAVDIGGGKATAVTVVQTAAATAVGAVDAVAAAKQTTEVTFSAVTAGQTVIIDGLTFTASKALTAAQVAAAFASIAAGAGQGSAAAGNGIYTGALTNFSSGAVVTSGTTSKVVFTEKTAGTNGTIDVDNGTATAPTIGTTVAGTAAVDAVEGVLGVVGGAVTINDDAGGKLATVTLNGTGAASITSDKLTTLNVANTDQNVTVVNTAATTLALTADNLGVDATGTIALGGVYTTLNLTAASDSVFTLTGAGVATLAVSGAGVADLGASTLGALKTVTVSGSAGLNLVTATATKVDTSATTGNSSIGIDSTVGTFTGGAGKDTVTVSSTTVTKAITLGAGDDTLDLTAFTAATLGATVSGGDGTDTLVLDSAVAETNSATNTFATKFDGFEKLSLTQAAADLTVDLANLDNISYVISAGAAAGFTETLKNLAAAGTVELTTAKGDAASLIDVQLADTDGTSDVLNLVLKNGANTDFGKVNVDGVETVNITATDSTATTINTHTLDLTAADAKAIVVTGNANVTLTGETGNVVLASLDGSAMTGKLIASTNGTVAETIKGGSAADTLTAAGNGDTLNGGAGADTLIVTGNLATLTGGAGNDTFNVAAPTTNVNSYATITDLAAGDIIKFAASAVDFNASKVSLADTAVFQDYANAAVAATDTGDVSWFQIGGNTYVIDNVSNGTTFTNGTDVIVKITGLVDLSHSSFSATTNTLVVIS
jgi:S-layer protein